MALPSSGTIKISQIRAELGTSSGSLRYLSSLAGFSTPDRMSDFYGYGATATIYVVVYSDYGYIQANINGVYQSALYGYGNSATYTVNSGSTVLVSAGDSPFGMTIDVVINSIYIGSFSGSFASTPTYTTTSGSTYNFTAYDGF